MVDHTMQPVVDEAIIMSTKYQTEFVVTQPSPQLSGSG